MQLLFYHDHSLLDRAIQWVTRSPYNHVAIQLGDSLVYESAQDGVVRLEGQRARDYAAQAALALPLSISAEDETEVHQFLELELGNRYPILSLLLAGLATLCPRLALVVSDPHQFICSALATMCCQIAGQALELEARTTTPAQLARALGGAA